MIPVPTPPVRGQRITADLLRDLIEAVRRCRPLQGQGILLQETMQGTVIAAAAAPRSAGGAEPFDHRFKVTARAEGDGDAPTYALHIRKGDLFEVDADVATLRSLDLEGLAQDPDDPDAWRVPNAAPGSLYIKRTSTMTRTMTRTMTSASAETGTSVEYYYTLAYGEPTDALFVIADFTPSESSSNPRPKVTQRVLGDLYAFRAGTGGGLTVGPPELLEEGGETSLAWYAGTVEWDTPSGRHVFTRATAPDGSAAEPLFTLPLVAHRKDHAPGIPYTEQ